MPTFPTLSQTPDFPLSPDGQIEDLVLRSQAEAGYEQTRPRFTRARRRWGVNYSDLPDADVAILRAFEITTLRNGADAFDWTHPLGGTYNVRLAAPIDFSRHTPTVANVAFTLQEV